MREYKRAERTEVRAIAWVFIVAAVLIGFLIVPAFGLEISEIPKVWLVLWCTLLSSVVTKLVNFGM